MGILISLWVGLVRLCSDSCCFLAYILGCLLDIDLPSHFVWLLDVDVDVDSDLRLRSFLSQL